MVNGAPDDVVSVSMKLFCGRDKFLRGRMCSNAIEDGANDGLQIVWGDVPLYYLEFATIHSLPSWTPVPRNRRGPTVGTSSFFVCSLITALA